MADTTHALTPVHLTLTAATVEICRLPDAGGQLEVTNWGTTDVTVTVGTPTAPADPVVGADGTHRIPAGLSKTLPMRPSGLGYIVKLLSVTAAPVSLEVRP